MGLLDAIKQTPDERAEAKAEKLSAHAHGRYLVVAFEHELGPRPPGDPRLINALADRGWRLVSATAHGLYFERG